MGKRSKRIKYEQPGGQGCRPDVHPFNFQRLQDASVSVWFVEGEKKADALTSQGACAVALTGVWMFRQGRKFYPELEAVPFAGRKVRTCYDSDIHTNANVQGAAERLTRELEERGARVLVVYLRDGADDSKVGADDYLAGGGTVAGLEALARSFQRTDTGAARLRKDRTLADTVAGLWADWREMPVKTTGQNTD